MLPYKDDFIQMLCDFQSVHPKLGLVPPVYMPCVIILVYNSSQGLCVEDLALLLRDNWIINALTSSMS